MFSGERKMTDANRRLRDVAEAERGGGRAVAERESAGDRIAWLDVSGSESDSSLFHARAPAGSDALRRPAISWNAAATLF